MSPLTPDERALLVKTLREDAESLGPFVHDGRDPAYNMEPAWKQQEYELSCSLLALADKLEAEPEPQAVEPITTLWRCPECGSLDQDQSYTGNHDFDRNPDCWKNERVPFSVFAEEALRAIERERDEAREELADVRTHLEDARFAVEGVDGGSTPPDWSVVDLAEDVAKIAQGEYRGRVEALEALRNLRNVYSMDAGLIAGSSEQWNALVAASSRADEILEGVERTHTLVPNAALVDLERVLTKGSSSADWYLYRSLLQEAIRGESVTWPTEERGA